MAASAARRVVLLTGCTGMAGTRVLEQAVRLVRASREAGHPLPFTIRAAVRDPAAIRFPGGFAGEACGLDMSKPESFSAALKDVERVFVLYHPMYGVSVPPFLDACRDAGVKHVVMMTVRVCGHDDGMACQNLRPVPHAARLLHQRFGAQVMHADTLTVVPHHKAEKQLRAACAGDSTDFAAIEPLPGKLESDDGDLRLWEDEAIDTVPDDTAGAGDSGDDAPDAGRLPPDDGLGMTFTLIRPSWFMENLARPGIHLPDIVESDLLYMPAGSGRVHVVHGSDVGEVIARLCMNEPGAVRPRAAHCGQAYALTGSERPSFEEVRDGRRLPGRCSQQSGLAGQRPAG